MIGPRVAVSVTQVSRPPQDRMTIWVGDAIRSRDGAATQLGCMKKKLEGST